MRHLLAFVAGAAVMITFLALLGGCACDGGWRNMSAEWCAEHQTALHDHAGEFRWDQGALHGSDHATCPSAVYVVRNGVLVECAP